MITSTRLISALTLEQSMLEARLLRHRYIHPETGCWIWTGAKDDEGYGEIWILGKQCRLNRIIGHLYFGLNLEDKKILVLHKCHNKSCFNPAHLELGSNSKNMSDYGRHIHPEYCKRGHRWRDGNEYFSRRARLCRACQTQHMREYRIRKKNENV